MSHEHAHAHAMRLIHAIWVAHVLAKWNANAMPSAACVNANAHSNENANAIRFAAGDAFGRSGGRIAADERVGVVRGWRGSADFPTLDTPADPCKPESIGE